VSETIYLVVETRRLRELRDPSARDYYMADLYITDGEPPISNDHGLIQIPITELLLVAENSAFNADKEVK